MLPCGPCPARAFGLCGALGHAELIRLAPLARIVEVARGKTFIGEATPAEHLCVIVVGSARLYKLLPDGRRQIIGFGFAGSLLGLAAVAGYGFSAEAIEPSRVCRLSRAGLRAMFDGARAIERRLLEIAVSELVGVQEQMLLLGRKTALERIASFLMLQRARDRARAAVQPRIHLPMSRGDIADYLGLTIETISRALAHLKSGGVIAVPNAHEVVILDTARLAALAGGALPDDEPGESAACGRGMRGARTCGAVPGMPARPAAIVAAHAAGQRAGATLPGRVL